MLYNKLEATTTTTYMIIIYYTYIFKTVYKEPIFGSGKSLTQLQH